MKAFRRSLRGEDKDNKPSHHNHHHLHNHSFSLSLSTSKPRHVSLPAKVTTPIAIDYPKKIIRALYDYQPDPLEAGPHELSFTKGDFFYVTARENDSDWYEVCNPAPDPRASVAGIVPVSFFETVRGARSSNPEDKHGSASAAASGNDRKQHLSAASSRSKTSSVDSSGSSRYNYSYPSGGSGNGNGNGNGNLSIEGGANIFTGASIPPWSSTQPHIDLRSPTFSIPEDGDAFALRSVAAPPISSHPPSQAQSRSHSTSQSRAASPIANENTYGNASAGLGIGIAIPAPLYDSSCANSLPPLNTKFSYQSAPVSSIATPISPTSPSNFTPASSPPRSGSYSGYHSAPIEHASPLRTKNRCTATTTFTTTGTMTPMTSVSSTHGGGAGTGKGSMVYAVVLYDFKAERPDELDAKEGDAIIVIARSTPDWVVAKPIGKLGGPGLVPVSFLEIRDLVTGQPAADNLEAIIRAGVPKVEEWKKQTAEYKNSSITLGKLDASGSAHDSAVLGGKGSMVGMAPSHASLPSVRSGLSGHSARTRESGRSGRSSEQHGHLVEQMGRLGVNDEGHGQYVSDNFHAHSDHLEPPAPPPNTYTPVLAPVSASIPRYTFDQDTYWYTIECKMEDGSCWELQRYYEDFYQLQINLLNAFDAEAGRIEGHPRTLPFMPGPVKVVTDAISNGRRQNLDEYIKKLLTMPPHVSRCQYVRLLFVPREGDFEIDPVLYNDELACVDSTLDTLETPTPGAPQPHGEMHLPEAPFSVNQQQQQQQRYSNSSQHRRHPSSGAHPPASAHPTPRSRQSSAQHQPQPSAEFNLPYPPSISGSTGRHSNRTSAGSGATTGSTSRTTTMTSASANGAGVGRNSGGISSMPPPPPPPTHSERQTNSLPHAHPGPLMPGVAKGGAPISVSTVGYNGHASAPAQQQSQSQSQVHSRTTSQSQTQSRPPSVTSPTSLIPPTKNPNVIVASIPATTSATAVKIKISYHNEWLAIRVAEDISLDALREKLRERLKIAPGSDIHVQVQKKEVNGDGADAGGIVYMADLSDQGSWEEIVRAGNGKVTLYVEDI